MTELGSTQPIIIKKKVAGHGGHHGGAWKVAYADFVTAMMALFIVLWLMNSNETIKNAVGGYFSDPTGQGKQAGSGQSGSGEGLTITKNNLGDLKDQIDKAMKGMPEFNTIKDQVKMTVTGEGLRIELLETEKGLFFERGNADPSTDGKDILVTLAKELGNLPNELMVEGHTDSRPYTGRPDYSNWELSADRANAARRLMLENGLKPDQVKQIRGFADQRLLRPDAPEDASNRRISVIVRYLPAPTQPGDPSGPASSAPEGRGHTPARSNEGSATPRK
jgi:chemotaxis protein MotB